MTVGAIIRKYREDAGLSRQELSKRSGVSARVIETIEADSNETSVFNIFKVAEELNVSFDDWETIEDMVLEHAQSPQHVIDLLEFLVCSEKFDKAERLLGRGIVITNKEQALLLDLYRLQIGVRKKTVSEVDIHTAIAKAGKWPITSVFAQMIFGDWMLRNDNHAFSYKIFKSQKAVLENLGVTKVWEKSLYIRLLDLLAFNAYNIGNVPEAAEFATIASQETYCPIIRARMFLLLSSCHYKTDYEKAVQLVHNAKELYNTIRHEHYAKICDLQLMHICLYNDVIEGVEDLVESVQQLGDMNAKSELLYYHVKKGNANEIERLYAEIERSDSDYAKAYANLYLAEYAYYRGQKEECVNYLYKAIYYFKKCGNNAMIIESIQILNHLGVAKHQLLAIAGGIIDERRDIGEKAFGPYRRGSSCACCV